MTFPPRPAIFLVAVLRTLLVWCILTAMEQYRMFLLRREHEKRYQELLLLISRLNGEVLWMDKNTALIEKNHEHRLSAV